MTPMRAIKRFLVVLALLSVNATAADAPNASDSLRRFFNEVRSYTARFQQVSVDEQQKPIQESSGRLWLERPNKFRWNYDKPRQQIVGDGERVWVYDEELAQISVRPMATGLADTPALLLAGRGRIEDAFALKNQGEDGDINWVELLPKRKDSGFEKLRLGFEKGKLRIIEMLDGLGHTTRYTLRNGEENISIDPARFQFVPPKGVDVVGE